MKQIEKFRMSCQKLLNLTKIGQISSPERVGGRSKSNKKVSYIEGFFDELEKAADIVLESNVEIKKNYSSKYLTEILTDFLFDFKFEKDKNQIPFLSSTKSLGIGFLKKEKFIKL